MQRHLLLAVLAGVVSAIVFAPFISQSLFAIFVSPFTMLPLFLVGMSMGTGGLLVSGAAATLISGILGGFVGAVMYAVAEAAPAVLLSHLSLRRQRSPSGARNWAPAGPVMQSAVIYACVLFVIPLIMLAAMGVEGGLRGYIEQSFLAASGAPELPAQPDERIIAFAREVSYWSPVSSSIAWLLFTMASLWIAQALLTRWKRNLRPALGMRDLQVPRWNMALLGLALVLWILGSGDVAFAGASLAIILAMPYTFIGIVIVHMLVRGWAPGPFFLTGFYLLLAFTRWPALIPAAALGFADQWVKLRDKIGGPTAT